jgi:hypothetical protein
MKVFKKFHWTYVFVILFVFGLVIVGCDFYEGYGGGNGTGLPTATPVPCAGTWYWGSCWYLGAGGDSCDEVCESHEGYHEATRFYTGSDGTDYLCFWLLSHLGAPMDADETMENADTTAGCYYWYSEPGDIVHWTRGAIYTSSDSADRDWYRACACVQ